MPNTNIPVPGTPLLGRQAEVSRLVDALSQPATTLVTLLGPGGVGKTRVALEASSRLARTSDRRVVFVDLAPVQSADFVLTAIGVALDVRETGEGDLFERIAAVIGGGGTLLVLDTFEHVISAAELVSRLLRAVPGQTVLVTSREVLNLSLERVVPLEPFSQAADLPNPSDSPAVRLFIERAAADGIGIPDNALPTVAAICDRLEGLPLAIELAAARCRVLSPARLLERLDERQSVLDTGPRDVPSRHRTMRNAIQWSFELLDPHEQRQFGAMSVFVGGATPDLLEAFLKRVNDRSGRLKTSKSALAVLGSLVDKSLLVRTGDDGAEPRLKMLDTVREFASESLTATGEREEANRDHAQVLTEWSERIKPLMFTANQAQWLDRAEVELPNIRAALTRAIGAGDTTIAARLLAGVMPIWLKRGYFAEGRDWCTRVLALNDEFPTEALIVLHFGAGSLAQSLGDHNAAMAHVDTALPLARAANDALGQGILLLLKTWVCVEVGDLHEAQATAEVARQLVGAFPGRFQLAAVLRVLTDIALVMGDDVKIEQYAEAAQQAALQSGDDWEVAACLLQRVKIALGNGKRDQALDLAREGVQSWRSLGDPAGLAESINHAALVASELGDELTAVRWQGAAAASLERINAVPSVLELADRDRVWQIATRSHAASHVQDAWNRGMTQSLETVCAEIGVYIPPADPTHTKAGQPTDALTAREREVLELVALGKTNKDIGAALFISHRTAGAHIVNILNKLGVDSRAAAAAWAVRTGIL